LEHTRESRLTGQTIYGFPLRGTTTSRTPTINVPIGRGLLPSCPKLYRRISRGHCYEWIAISSGPMVLRHLLMNGSCTLPTLGTTRRTFTILQKMALFTTNVFFVTAALTG